jgi:hypothetical protein
MRRIAILSAVVLLGLTACGDLDIGRQGDRAARQQRQERQQRRQEKKEEARKEAKREQRAKQKQRAKQNAADSQDAGEQQQEECTPGYSPCLVPASDYDCEGGSGDGPMYTGQVEVTGSDIYDLDSDDDGIGCDP